MLMTIFQFIAYLCVCVIFYKFLDAPLWASIGFAAVISLQLVPTKDEE